MRKNIKYFGFIAILTAFLMINGVNIANSATAVAPVKPATASVEANACSVSPVDVVNNPAKYLHKDITFNAEFIAFSGLGLDYKPAFRDGTKYISVLIRRTDVSDHTVPLSEMKIFVSRELAEKNIDIEMGDKIKIVGNVFSNALGDPWVDAKSFTIVQKKAK